MMDIQMSLSIKLRSFFAGMFFTPLWDWVALRRKVKADPTKSVIYLSDTDWDALMASMQNPAEPSEALKKLMQGGGDMHQNTSFD